MVRIWSILGIAFVQDINPRESLYSVYKTIHQARRWSEEGTVFWILEVKVYSFLLYILYFLDKLNQLQRS